MIVDRPFPRLPGTPCSVSISALAQVFNQLLAWFLLVLSRRSFLVSLLDSWLGFLLDTLLGFSVNFFLCNWSTVWSFAPDFLSFLLDSLLGFFHELLLENFTIFLPCVLFPSWCPSTMLARFLARIWLSARASGNSWLSLLFLFSRYSSEPFLIHPAGTSDTLGRKSGYRFRFTFLLPDGPSAFKIGSRLTKDRR